MERTLGEPVDGRLPGISVNFNQSRTTEPWFVKLKYTDKTTKRMTKRKDAFSNPGNSLNHACTLGLSHGFR